VEPVRRFGILAQGEQDEHRASHQCQRQFVKTSEDARRQQADENAARSAARRDGQVEMGEVLGGWFQAHQLPMAYHAAGEQPQPEDQQYPPDRHIL
jgi:hypothetical protein